MRRVAGGGAGLILLLPLCLLLGSCDACKDQPRFHLIAGDPSLKPSTTYNVLFLGSGFRGQAELEFYRRAAHELATHAMGLFPHSEALQFWRVDLKSDPIKEWCPNFCPHTELDVTLPPGLAVPAPLDVYNPDGVKVMDKELEVSVCRKLGSGSCDDEVIHVGPKGEPRAHELAATGPHIRTIVILANTTLPVGATRVDSCGSGVDRIVMGLPQPSEDEEPGPSVLDQSALDLFAHEMGHALGLMDEYTKGIGLSPFYCADRNLWRPLAFEPCQLDPETAPPAPPWKLGDPVCPEIPWKDELKPSSDDPTCDVALLDLCCDSGAGAVPEDETSPADEPVPDNPDLALAVSPPCQEVFAPALERCPDLDPGSFGQCPVDTMTGEPQGIWEGGHYSETGTYRAMGLCKMSNNESGFCIACRSYLDRTLAELHAMVEPRD